MSLNSSTVGPSSLIIRLEMMKTDGEPSGSSGTIFIWSYGPSETAGRGSFLRIEPMTGKSENIVHYTAEELEARRRQGQGQTDWEMPQQEAMRRRHADPEAPRPYPGWQDTVRVSLPEPKEQITLRLDCDMLRWFRAKGEGYKALINAVLRDYYEHEHQKEGPDVQ
jgi:uncharacterized protein (DUF4415 family)